MGEVHHEVVVAGGVLLQRADARDVLVAEVADELEVRPDLLHLPFVVRHVGRQPLDGDLDAADLVEALVDHAHAPLPELGLHDIPPEDHFPRRKATSAMRRIGWHGGAVAYRTATYCAVVFRHLPNRFLCWQVYHNRDGTVKTEMTISACR